MKTNPKTKTTTTLASIAAIVLLGATAAGCGSPNQGGTGGGDGASGRQSRSADASGAAASGDAASSKSRSGADAEKLVKFAECIRSHGVPNFPDANAKGEFEFGIDVTPDVWTKAVDACKDLQPPGTFSSERSPKEQAASLTFARCMREHGVPDFPDPVQGEPLINTYEIPSSDAPGGMDRLNAAADTCKRSLDAALAGR